MHPPVLCGVFPHKGFNGLGVLLRDPADGVVHLGPFLGEDDALHPYFKTILIADAAAVAHGDRHAVDSGHDSNTLEGAGRSAKKGDKEAFLAGVLVRDQAQAGPLTAGLRHEVSSALFVYDLLAVSFSNAADVLVEVFVVQGTGHAGEVEAKESHDVAEDLEVAVVAGHQDDTLALLHEPLGVFDVLVLPIRLPVFLSGQVGGQQQVHAQHGNLFEASSGGLDKPGLVFFWIGCAEVFKGPFTAARIAEPEQPTQCAGNGKCQTYRQNAEQGCEHAHGHVNGVVQPGVRFFVSTSFSGFCHGAIVWGPGHLSSGFNEYCLDEIQKTRFSPIPYPATIPPTSHRLGARR